MDIIMLGFTKIVNGGQMDHGARCTHSRAAPLGNLVGLTSNTIHPQHAAKANWAAIGPAGCLDCLWIVRSSGRQNFFAPASAFT
jgi:hypothetical protein